MHRWTFLGVLLSAAAHVGVAVAVVALPRNVVPRHALVSVYEKKPKKEEKKTEEKPKDEPPPPPKKEPPRAPRPKAPEIAPPPPPPSTPPPAAAAHPQLAALPNLGITMAGGPGAGPGIAVPPPQAAGPADAAARAVEGPVSKPKPRDDCLEDAVKPKLVGAIPQDRIIAAA